MLWIAAGVASFNAPWGERTEEIWGEMNKRCAWYTKWNSKCVHVIKGYATKRG